VRHAQSTNNALGDSAKERHHDSPLTELGLKQAERVAKHLAVITSREAVAANGHVPKGQSAFTHLFCSPMTRAMQTAQPIAEALGLTPEIWVDIHEEGGVYLDQDDGSIVGYPGKNRAEIGQEFPGYALPDEITDKGWWDANRGHESETDSQARAVRVARRLWELSRTEDSILIVSHGTFLDMTLKVLFGMQPTRNLYFLHNNTAITRLSFREDGSLIVFYINRVDHLPAAMMT
jgi:2,3-bisphosphoglycerate-dependent phosphoglycerate mutase